MTEEKPNKTVIDLRIEVTPASDNDNDHLAAAKEIARELARSANWYASNDNDDEVTKAGISLTVRVWQIVDNKVVVKLKEGADV